MIDLRPDQLDIVKAIIHQYVPNYEVWAFGSRVAGTAKLYSDLDLTVISDLPLDFELLGSIRDAFSESDLPFKVDLGDWATTSNEFRAIIKSKYEIIKEKI